MDFKDVFKDILGDYVDKLETLDIDNINRLKEKIENSPMATKIYEETFDIYCDLRQSQLTEKEQNELLKEFFSKIIRIINILDSEDKINNINKEGKINE